MAALIIAAPLALLVLLYALHRLEKRRMKEWEQSPDRAWNVQAQAFKEWMDFERQRVAQK